MSFDFDSHKLRGLYFVKITKNDGTILRFSNESTFARDTDNSFQFFEGRLFGVSALTTGFNDFRDGASIVSQITLKLRNGKLTSDGEDLDTIIGCNNFSNLRVQVFLADFEEETVVDIVASSGLRVGPGNRMGPGLRMGTRAITRQREEFDLNNATLLFDGFTGFPNAYREYNEDMIAFDVFDQSFNDQLADAPNRFDFGPANTSASSDGRDGTTFLEMKESVVGFAAPIVYGNFTQSFFIPGFVVIGFPLDEGWFFKYADSSANVLFDGQVASSGFTEISFLEIEALTRASSDIANGIAVTFRDEATNKEDGIVIDGSGKTHGTDIATVFGVSSGDLMQHPAIILFDLIKNRLSVPITNIDSQSFVDRFNDDTTIECRAAFTGSRKLIDQIDALAFEFNFYLDNSNGKFRLSSLSVDPSTVTSVKSIVDADIQPNTYKIRLDPNKSFFNTFVCNFSRNFSRQVSSQTIDHRVLSKVAEYGDPRNLNFDFIWTWKRVDCLERIGELFSYFVNPIKVVELSLTSFRGMNLSPNDVIDLTFHIFDAKKMLIRRITKDPATFQTRLILWPMPDRQFNVYAGTADTAPADYAAADSAAFGVFHATLEIIEGFNDVLTLDVDDGGVVSHVVTMSPTYFDTPDLFAAQLALDLASTTSNTWTVTYSSTTREFTITITTGGATFALTTVSEQLAKTVLAIDPAGESQNASKVSENPAIFDTDDDERVTEFA